MSVEVAAEDDATAVTPWLSVLFIEIFNKLLSVVNRRMQVLARLFPATVQIDAKQTDSVVAVDDTIGIEHWDDLDYELLPDLLSFRVIR